MEILPFGEVRRFVDEDWVDELAPAGARFHEWRSVGAVIRPFRWRPVFRRSGNVNEPMRHPPGPFVPEARRFLDLLAVSHAASVASLASISDCIDRSAAQPPRRGEPGSGDVPEMGGGWLRRVFRVPGAAAGGV